MKPVKSVTLLVCAALAALAMAGCAESKAAVTVYKTPTCGCCVKWIDHLEAAGFSVEAHDLQDLRAVKRENGVASRLEACHTARVEGYVIEGHVPASDIVRLLDERPAIAGLAVPGMPIGSPGMEGPGAEPYAVLSFDADGTTEVFSTHAP